MIFACSFLVFIRIGHSPPILIVLMLGSSQVTSGINNISSSIILFVAQLLQEGRTNPSLYYFMQCDSTSTKVLYGDQ